MPIYEYQCTQCGHQLEAIQKISDQPLVECPHCHAQTLQKLVSAGGFQLKGTGWYATDFRNADKPKTPKSTETETKKTEEKPSGTDTTTKTSDSGSDSKGQSTAT